MSEACQETMSLINSLKLFIKEELTRVKLYCDNQAAESSTKISVSNKLRHMSEVKKHYVRECVERKLITVRWIPSKEQLSDIFTKALPLETHDRSNSRILILDKDTS